MQVKDVMTANVERVPPDTPVREAATKMRDLDVGAIPVYEGDKLIGMVTDRDIAIRGVAEGRDPENARVGEVMTAGVITCYADQDVAEAAHLMRDKQVRRLVVLDHDNRLAGIVSLGDLAVETGNELLTGNTLEAVSEPAEARR